MVTVGIDIGSTATKAVVFDGMVRGRAVVPTGWEPREAGLRAFREALSSAGLREESVSRVVGTGYGRVSLPFSDQRVTEISCHARGAWYLNPDTRAVIDIGGQDSKVILVSDDGSVSDFIMNDKCAAGTGRFLQVMAGILDLTLDELGSLAASSEPVPLTSMCTVFAESEIIGLLAQGTPKGAIAAGIIDAIARRMEGLVGRLEAHEGITFTGGLATNGSISGVIARRLGLSLHVPEDPQVVGALGAALIGCNA
ncbi:acyl-CoA dehydratase activase [Geobacter sulfurreducens]|uniref:acyl-CoA dehydratase activase n=1 Tax=Geobacter sulfurreducens TaxID=35554 RepID=UPI000DBB2517|nr:acyl-CoA dehydratase activase [Geobacter sulfurreducens]BBA70949.1 R-phenyllactate dehydratase activator [Geobacter sulfurreducens]